jgi:hypothetical protein
MEVVIVMDCYLIGTRLVLSNSFEEACTFYKKIYPFQCEEYIFGKYGTSKIDPNSDIFIINKPHNDIEAAIYIKLLSDRYTKCIKYNNMDFEKEYPLECIRVSIEKLINIIKDKIEIPAIINEYYNPQFPIFEYKK